MVRLHPAVPRAAALQAAAAAAKVRLHPAVPRAAAAPAAAEAARRSRFALFSQSFHFAVCSGFKKLFTSALRLVLLQ